MGLPRKSRFGWSQFAPICSFLASVQGFCRRFPRNSTIGRLPLRNTSYILANAGVIVLLSAGTAVGASGQNTIFGNDIADGAVHSSDIKNDAIQGKDVRDGSLTGKDIADHSLTTDDFTGTVIGEKGETGATGATGPIGPQGPPGPPGPGSGSDSKKIYSAHYAPGSGVTGDATDPIKFFDGSVHFTFPVSVDGCAITATSATDTIYLTASADGKEVRVQSNRPATTQDGFFNVGLPADISLIIVCP
jgi:hypothetical protein